jgi:hypothetical protein
MARLTDDELRDRVVELRAWSRSRIAHADAEIDRCGEAGAFRAGIEKQALEAVLRILDGEESPHV